jgi:hypothetical protein
MTNKPLSRGMKGNQMKKYVTKTITVPVTITWDATEVSDETGAHVVDANLLSIDVGGFEFNEWPDAVDHMRGLVKFGEWE